MDISVFQNLLLPNLHPPQSSSPQPPPLESTSQEHPPKIDRRRKPNQPNQKKLNDPAFWDVDRLKAYIEENKLHDKLPEVGRGTNGKLVKPDYLFVVRQHRKDHIPRKRSRKEISE